MSEIDQYMLFSNNQAITGATLATNVIDLSAVRSLGVGPRPLYLVSQVTVTFDDSGNNSNMTVIAQTDDNAAISSGTNIQTIGVFATNTAAGTRLVQQLSPNNTYERYLTVYYDVGNGNFGNASVTTYLTADPQFWTARAAGYTGPTTS